MIQQRHLLRLLLALIVMLGACSDFWGEGPDPSRAGRYTGGTNAGGSSSCNHDVSLALLLAANGFGCQEVTSCTAEHCGSSVDSCLGRNFSQGQLSGSQCDSYASCVMGCNCDQNCLNGCMSQDSQCSNCLNELRSCQESACAEQDAACLGAGGASPAFPITLAANLTSNINDIALDETHLYFTTNQGVAKVKKTGGAATPIGGVSGVLGLAVADGFVYFAENSGAVMRMAVDGKGSQIIVPGTMGGGSSAIVIDGDQLFYTVGPNLRRAPLAGGSATDLTGDNFQQGPSSPRRLAVDEVAAYYVGADQTQGASVGSLRSFEKDAPPSSGGGPGGLGSGTTLAAAAGEIRAIVSDGKSLYYTELGSDGLNQQLEVKSLLPSNKRIKSIATTKPSGNDPGGGYTGTALATDGVSLYFGGFKGLYRVPIDGGEVETLSASATPGVLALDDDYVYWSELAGNPSIKKLAR